MVKLLENVTLLNGETTNIVIENNEIAAITKDRVHARKTITFPNNVIVSPGWIDLHTHAFPKFKPYCSHPDEIGYKSGVTTVVDAGSSGADDIDEFFEVANEHITNVLSIINISRIGLKQINELADLSNISYEAIASAIERHEDNIVGLKARMSGSVVETNDIVPLKMARKFSKQLHLPIMVHIGNAPPNLGDILETVAAGDIITHCFHGKEGNNIFDHKEALLNAIERGVYLDIGHGTASFSFEIAKKSMLEKIPFHTISTDIYDGNKQNGPVYNMATTMTKFLHLGYSLKEVIRAVTEIPAKIINKPELGTLSKGTVADLTFFTVKESPLTLVDSLGKKEQSSLQIKPHSVVIGGKYYVCK